jgi:glutamate dehydrogenase (NADP+)
MTSGAQDKAGQLFGRRFTQALGPSPLPEDVLQEITEPQRVVSARLKIARAGAAAVLARGWRLCLSDVLGPTKGGVRFHPGVSHDSLVSLAARILLKCAVNGLPHGGAAGGVTIDPKQLSGAELEHLARAYVRAFADVIGAERDILSPDLGTGAKVMAWMTDELNVLRRRQEPAAINGKPPGNGGIAGRHEATATGAQVVLGEFFAQRGWEPSRLTCAIQGFGAAGGTMAAQFAQSGMRVVAVSDTSGGWHAAGGLDVPALYKAKRAGTPLAAMTVPGATRIAPLQALEVPADLVIAAALGGQIDGELAPRMKCRAVVELANAACTDEADRYFESHDVAVLPDVVVNAGGITVSHFEWAQNRSGRLVPEEEVRSQLRERMRATAGRLLAAAAAHRVALPVAAQILAIDKLRLVYGV